MFACYPDNENAKRMIKRFTLENFRSIKEKVTLDLTATAIKELQSNTFDVEKNKLLKSVSLIGANASGKSNLLDGLVIMKHLVIESAKDYQSNESLPLEPFRLNTEYEYQPSFFEIELVLDSKTYIYGFRADSSKIHHEWLVQKLVTTSKIIFTREDDKYVFGKKWKKNSSIKRFSRENALFLSVAAQWNIELAESILQWFMNMNTLHGLSFRSYSNVSIDLMENKETRPFIINMMRHADFGIENIKVKKVKVPTNQFNKFIKDKYRKKLSDKMKDHELYEILTFHNKYNSKNEIVGKEQFKLGKEESHGTRKFFSLIGAILEAFLRGELVIIDELDARLHPDLVKEIIGLFNSKFNSQGQLICVNLHTSIMDNNLLRRDQIYLVEKNQYGATKINAYSEYDIRKGQPLEKNYREGRVGGKPMIQSFEGIFA